MEAPLRVACALIFDSGRVLIARRKKGLSNQGLWEFPGGKVKPGESDADCLARELREELSLDIEVGPFFMESGAGGILLEAYFARASGSIGSLQDHDGLAFDFPAALAYYVFSGADIPIARALAQARLPDRSVNS